MIPPLTPAGFLPLGRYPATEVEIRERFVDGAGNARRAEIWDHWIVATTHLRAITPVCAAWVGGSFLTDKAEPDDLDVVYVVGSRELFEARLNRPEVAPVLAAYASGKALREKFGWLLDTYITEWPRNQGVGFSMPIHGVNYARRGYWDELWSRRRTGIKGQSLPADALPSRGFLEVTLDGFSV